jgi:hypothetical protein
VQSLIRSCHSADYGLREARERGDLNERVRLGNSVPLLTKLGAIYRIAEGNKSADGLEEFHADEVHIASVLLAFNPGLNRRHAGGDQRGGSN